MSRSIRLNALGRTGALAPVCLMLLAMAQFAPGWRPVQAMQGRSSIDREFQTGETLGYYEDILNAAALGKRGPEGDRKRLTDGSSRFVPFGAAGIVQPTSTYLRWKIKPNLSLRWNGKTFRSNSLGYRTPEVSLDKPNGVYRIVVFGSSNTMGHGVADESPYPRLLESWLNQRLSPSVRVEVVNLAVSGDSPSRRLQRIREEASRYHADWILCDASPLDYSLEEGHLEAIVRGQPPIEIPFPFVRDALVRAEVSPSDSADGFRRKLKSVIETLLDGAYAGWKAEVEKLGVPFTMVIIPRADRKVQSPRIVALIGSIAESHGLDVIDISTAFDPHEESQFRVSEQDKHPSEMGHQAMFMALAREIEERGGMPGMPLPAPSSPLP